MIPVLLPTLLLAAALSTPLADPQPNVAIVVAARGGVADDVAVNLRLQPVDPQPSAPVERVVRGGIPMTMPLAKGTWTLHVDNDDLWHEPQTFVVTGGMQRVATTVWPRAAIEGTVAPGSSQKPIEEVIVRFESVDPRESLAGVVSCPVEQARFSCSVPAGLRDLRIRPRGYIAQYRLGADLQRGKSLSLGRFEFQEGQAITGRIQIPREYRSETSSVKVTAIPDGTGAGGQRLLTATAVPEPGGFFTSTDFCPARTSSRLPWDANCTRSRLASK